MRLDCIGKASAQLSFRIIDNPNALALSRAKERQSPKLAKSPVWARRQFQARRIGTIGNVEIVIAWQKQQAICELWIRRQRVEQFGPFGGTTSIGHVPRDKNCIQRIL